MLSQKLELVTYKLCPYVQRSIILLLEKKIPFTRTDIKLNNKPSWFLKLSPTGKVPLLRIDDEHIIFESAVICEYLDEISGESLLPNSPLDKAKDRAWIEYGSQLLSLIANYYSVEDKDAFNLIDAQLKTMFSILEKHVVTPYFSGETFSMVDAAFAPVFRYFDVFELRMSSDIFSQFPKLQNWRINLSKKPSVVDAVDKDYPSALLDFVIAKQSHLAHLIKDRNLIKRSHFY